MPNLGRSGYVDRVADLLPGSTAIPKEVYSLSQDKKEEEKLPWEDD